jgi:ATP-dependent helicase/nuclease subunit A
MNTSLDAALDQATTLQRMAADPAFSVWVSANAGTGKTRVLIDRISRLLLSGVRSERILCLTYTKAAAAEMEIRLSRRLGDWATMSDHEISAELLVLNGTPAKPTDIHRARQLFAETLETPGGLKIRTIHSFCESLLGRFPVEAQIAPHAAVMDERAAAELFTEAREHVYASAFRDDASPLAHAMKSMAGMVDESGFDDLMREVLAKRQRLTEGLRELGGLDGVEMAIGTVLDLDVGDTPETILHQGVASDAFDVQALTNAIPALETGTKKDAERAQDIAAWLVLDEASRARLFEDTYKPVFLKKTEGLPCALKNLITSKPADKFPDSAAALIAEQDRVFALSERMKAAVVGEGTKILMFIAHELINEYERLKRQRALLDYDDLILKSLALLERDGGAGWVHFKLDGGIDHILVDEAQDTSPEQWKVIRHMADEFFAGDGTRPPKDGDPDALPQRSIFAVGDIKQSIYSFQGAKPEEFTAMRDYFADRAGPKLKSIQLEQSFRTTSAVLDVVDAVFAQPHAQPGVAPDGGTRHRAQRSGHAGCVRLWPSVQKTRKVDPAPWDAPVDRVRETSPMSQTAEGIAETIDGWLSSGEILESRDRPVEAGDIMILVPKRGQFADEMVRRLKARNIPVAGSDRMIMTDQIAVMDMIAVARFVLLPEDDLNLAAVMKGPFIGLSEEDLFQVAFERPGTMWDSIRSQTKTSGGQFGEALKILSAWLARADYAPPFEFFSGLLGTDRGRAKLVARLGPEANDPIDEFLIQALGFERTHTPSLQGFLSWIDAANTQIKRDLEAAEGKVRVMTVHGSKGLEANIVILPDTCSVPDGRRGDRVLWAPAPGSGTIAELPIWPGVKANETALCESLRDDVKQSGIEEYRRLMYVAMTRARDRLYIAGWERKTGSKDSEHGRDEGSWYELVRPALHTMDGINEAEHGDGQALSFTTTQREAPEPDDSAGDTLAAATQVPSWMTAPPAPEPEPSTPLSPSRMEGDEPPVASPFDGDDTSRFRRGNLIHRLLQTLPELPVTERAGAMEAWLTSTAGDLDEQTRKRIAEETLAVLEDDQLSEIFEAGSMAEVPIAGTIMTTDGPKTIAGQVDRLVVTESAVMIVDFKTNRPPPLEQKDVAPSYFRQMALYKSALEHIYAGREIRCFLVWTDGPRAMLLNDEFLSEHAP